MYDVNFVYNALSFLRLTSRSSVIYVFVVFNKHILYLVVAKFPTLSRVSSYEPKGLGPTKDHVV